MAIFLPTGVPILLEPVIFSTQTLLTSDTLTRDILGSTFGGASQWGLFDDQGNLALDADSVLAVNPRREYLISDYPLEQGAFESYDKVQTPKEITLRLAKAGAIQDRQAFLDALDAIIDDLNLYTVVTPEISITSMNVVRYDYQRTAERGLGLITVELHLVEARVTAVQSFTNVATPPSADPVNGGTVQPQPTPAPQKSSILGSVF